MKNTQSSIINASYWMFVTLLSFSLMAVAVKELSEDLSTSQIIFFRSLVSLIILIPIVNYFGFKEIISSHTGKHVLRNVAHFLGQYGWIYGIAFIPLSEVFALEFTVPIWTALIAMILLKEKLNKSRIISIGLGVVGVVVILRPGIEIVHLASIAVLLGAFSYALSHTLTKSIVKYDSPLSIIFYMAVIQLPIGLVLSFDNWIMPSGNMWWWIVVAGIAALVAHFCMAKAMMFADAMVVVPMDFLRLPLIMIVGLLFYNENIEWLILVGALFMLAGNFVNLKNENKVRD